MMRKAKNKDVNYLAKIHCEELEGNLLVNLGENFISALYIDFLQDDSTIFFLKENKQVQGFIVGVTNFSKLFNKVIVTHFLRYLRILVPRFFQSPSLIPRTLGTFMYPKLEGKDTPNAELVVIAVRKKYQRKNIGTQLVAALEKELEKRQVLKYKVSCTADNKRANRFYKKLSFTKHHHFNLYSKKWYLYVKSL